MVVRRGGLIRRMVRRALRWAAFAVLVVSTTVLALRWVNPPVTWLMASEWWRLGAIEREWRALPAMSPYLPLSAVAAEDADFCGHSGFDFAGIRAALADDTRLRGGSTISQQVAKNVFLWPARSWSRKGLEAGFTVLIEILWPKRRILEVYLNVAEFDAGVFGVEAASRRYFGVGAADVGPQRAARLMAVLPDPRHRSPVSGTAFIRRRGAAIESGAATIREDGRADCFL
ncbi:MAG TPA: monofunctional biosynthetic peptidoglycan transglycosylase [Amaricoccus sp.]|uniref:monofunctional biosynthetic peptidoglycan transglycosylase n=1 Tax=Amaricoccus sp. TaxID=1872485 RepID=UPI002C991659|nr:monofunctional biosynthetic peptidoglycan transglycosylase [Amaricoccus sp.]HMQ93430.1 monofunctional biosynthetic peptidoglycan transglycosylase [Amaricoccus sp.]HMR51074.1 monofunctional biosynthetic peptidoglycan transglycosylase [Amaricoccus sp.]HMR59986.1 monofunctional biosynthetic peptidoglycan transglycosylase [Amaricoccus sp.]HMU00351.1 monofunctional biosynthetic peptidoglycan transglycosylase [Amaricoccus sp.]